MCSQSQNGHHEMSSLYLRRKKPSPSSRPFPPGFTPVIQVSPCTHRSIQKSDSGPTFLSPTLRSPLPPSNASLTIEEQQARPNRLVKPPPLPPPSQRTPAKLIPSVGRLCSATRPNQRPPSPSNSGPRPASLARGPPNHRVLQHGPANLNPTKTRLRSLSQHSYLLSIPKLFDLMPSSSSEISTRETGDRSRNQPVVSQVRLKTKSGSPRTRSLSTSLTTPRVARGVLARRPKEKPGNHLGAERDAPLECSCARRSTRESPDPRMQQRVEYAHTSCPRYNSHDSDRAELVDQEVDLKKLPDYVLDNWTGWTREILFGGCDSPSSKKPSFSEEVP